MSFRSRKQLKSMASLAIATVVIGSLYQNCSKIAVSDIASLDKAQEAQGMALGMDDETITAGLNQIPNLKMFFVVDNSGTMKENQLNLSESFGAMFDQNSADSLSKFDTTAYLFSTAQRSPSLASERSILDQISEQQKNFVVSTAVTVEDFNNSYRSATINTGLAPGDNIGYHLISSTNPTQYSFTPAPVLGASAQAGGLITWNPSIRKLASENASELASEFKARLQVLDSERIPLVSINGKYTPEHSSIVDAESGLCTPYLSRP